MVPKGEANQLRFHPTVGKAAVSLYPTGNGSAFSLLRIPFSEEFLKEHFLCPVKNLCYELGQPLLFQAVLCPLGT